MQVSRIALQTALMAFAIAAPLAVRVERAVPDVGALTAGVESLAGANDVGDAGKSVSGVQSTSEGVLATVPAVSPVENTVSSVVGTGLGGVTRRAIPDVGALATGVVSLAGVHDVGDAGKSVSGVQSTAEGVLTTVPAFTPLENTVSSAAGTGLNTVSSTGVVSTVQGILPIRRRH